MDCGQVWGDFHLHAHTKKSNVTHLNQTLIWDPVVLDAVSLISQLNRLDLSLEVDRTFCGLSWWGEGLCDQTKNDAVVLGSNP